MSENDRRIESQKLHSQVLQAWQEAKSVAERADAERRHFTPAEEIAYSTAVARFDRLNGELRALKAGDTTTPPVGAPDADAAPWGNPGGRDPRTALVELQARRWPTSWDAKLQSAERQHRKDAATIRDQRLTLKTRRAQEEVLATDLDRHDKEAEHAAVLDTQRRMAELTGRMIQAAESAQQ